MNYREKTPEEIIKARLLFTETQKIFETVREDFFKSMKRTEEEPKDQCWRRMAIRTAFTAIEASVFRMKVTVLRYLELLGKKLPLGEEAFIREEKFELTEKGKVKNRKFFLESKRNLRFTFNLCARIFNSDFKIDTNDKGWKSYEKGLTIRNRITHPKEVSDLTVTKMDYKTALEALLWFSNAQEKLANQIKAFKQKE